jgi:hypothetical protein
MEGQEPVCLECDNYHHWNFDGFTCDAFPAGIPAEILVGGGTHKKPIPGDNGIVFKQGDPMNPREPPEDWIDENE